MSGFEEYLEYGWTLTPLRPGTKEPRLKGWQLRENALSGSENADKLGDAAGLLLAFCDPPLMTLDIDDFDAAAAWFDDHGGDLPALLQAEDAVKIISGKPNKAKLLYRIDRPRCTRRITKDRHTILEFRSASAGSRSVQDVLPPSQHPDTGKPYRWGGLGHWRSPPLIPRKVLQLWDDANQELLSCQKEKHLLNPSSKLDQSLCEAELADALDSISPDINYHQWLAIGQGVNDALPGERGLSLWTDWSAKGQKYQHGECRKKWRSFNPGAGVTKATVFQIAYDNGWRKPPTSSQATHPFTANARTEACLSAPDSASAPTRQLQSRKISDMESKPIDWIWPGMLAGGKLHLIAGKGGRGKTTLLLNLAATVSRGRKFPCGAKSPQGRVLILSGEDGAEDTIRPRLVAAEADTQYCEILNPLVGDDFFEVSQHLPELENKILDCADARLLIFDPISAFIGSAENNSPTVIRSVLSRLHGMAERTGMAIVCVSHLRKGQEGDSDERVLGSGAWVHACRIVLGVTETEDHGPVLGKLKTNISAKEGVFPFSLELENQKDLGDVMKIDWGPPLSHTRYDELTEAHSTQRGVKIADAHEFLVRQLSRGAVSYRFISQEARKAEISDSTLNRAASELGVIRSRDKVIHAGTMWSLPT